MASGIRVRVNFKEKAIKKAVEKSMIRTLPRAGAFVRAIARNSLGRKRNAQDHSPVGQPPNTFGSLRRAILFKVSLQNDSVVIGPDSRLFANVGKAHEFGGPFRKEKFKKRPFMGPALIKAIPKLPKFWAKSVRS